MGLGRERRMTSKAFKVKEYRNNGGPDPKVW